MTISYAFSNYIYYRVFGSISKVERGKHTPTTTNSQAPSSYSLFLLLLPSKGELKTVHACRCGETGKLIVHWKGVMVLSGGRSLWEATVQHQVDRFVGSSWCLMVVQQRRCCSGQIPYLFSRTFLLSSLSLLLFCGPLSDIVLSFLSPDHFLFIHQHTRNHG